MEISSLSSMSSTTPAAMVAETAGTLVMRKVLDAEAAQGAMLAQLMDQTAGIGRNLNTTA